MDDKKVIVKIDASFSKGRDLFDTIKKYAKHSNEEFAWWDEFAFTVEDLPEYDALLIFNNPSGKTATICYPENVIAFMMEPGVRAEHPWMFKGLDQYAKVFSPLQNSSNTVLSHGYLGWHFSHNYTFFEQLAVPEKKNRISCITSTLSQLKGHQLRVAFVKMLGRELPEIDFFGKGSFFLPDKLDALLPYCYSIAIENSAAPYYFTEKINDCFLAYTVPVYYGCSNIEKYFPEKSFIRIDIKNPGKAIELIKEIILHDNWEERLEAVKEARELVLNKYQPLAGAAAVWRETQRSMQKKKILTAPVPQTIQKKITQLIGKLTGNQ